VDCVVVYKVDRLSRSLLDFARIMATFGGHKVSFVSVTQAFNTATSMGRLILNVLLSFAQFEREMISERTRDKIAAARRKGKWSGGMPVLGYTVNDTKLVVDKREAEIVRQIFDLYLENQSLLAVVQELQRRGWRTKRWTTRKGLARGGRPFDKCSLYQLLTNPVYIGKVRYKDEVHAGEHKPIVDADVFQRAQTLLLQNGRSGGRAQRNKHGAILRGLLRCRACDCAMSHSFSSKGSRRYRYYVCQRAQKNGWEACPSPSIPAGEIERIAIDEIKCIGRDPTLIKETLAQARAQAEDQLERLKAERTAVAGQLRADHAELGSLAGKALPDDPHLADLNERVGDAERRLSEVESELATLGGNLVDEAEVAAALSDFNAVWDCLAPREQARIVELLVEQVVYDHERGGVAIAFRETGIKTLAAELAAREEAA
jgi:site-specific DNA recombinase